MRPTQEKISVIIPCNHPMQDLVTLLDSIFVGELLPDEVVIVTAGKFHSAIDAAKCSRHFTEIYNAPIFLIYVENGYPGKARNIGISKSTGNVIALIDVKTIPTRRWLRASMDTLGTTDADLVLGACKFESRQFSDGVIRDVIFGRDALSTLPGALFRRDVLSIVGQMLERYPAGEDGDWIARFRLHGLSIIAQGEATLSYTGLIGFSYRKLLFKWWKYYYYSAELLPNEGGRHISLFLLIFLSVTVAYNWNFRLSENIFNEMMYFPHLTKFILLIFFLAYVLYRVVYRPRRRGVRLSTILSFRFPCMLANVLLLDFLKVTALLWGTFRKRVN